MGRVAGLTGAIFKLGMPPVIILAGVLSDAGENLGSGFESRLGKILIFFFNIYFKTFILQINLNLL